MPGVRPRGVATALDILPSAAPPVGQSLRIALDILQYVHGQTKALNILQYVQREQVLSDDFKFRHVFKSIWQSVAAGHSMRTGICKGNPYNLDKFYRQRLSRDKGLR